MSSLMSRAAREAGHTAPRTQCARCHRWSRQVRHLARRGAWTLGKVTYTMSCARRVEAFNTTKASGPWGSSPPSPPFIYLICQA